MSNVTAILLSKYLFGLPAIYTAASKKFENSKARTIYPTDNISYAIETYTIESAEVALNGLDSIGLPGDCEYKLRSML